MDVTVLTTTKSRNNVGNSINNGIKNVKIFSFKNIWQINPVSFIIPYLKKPNFDIIHVHSYLYFISNQEVFFGRLKKIHTLLHLHGGVGLPLYQTSTLKITAKAFYDKTLGDFTIKYSDLVASISKLDLRQVKAYYIIHESKCIHILNAVDFKLFSNYNYSNQSENDDSFPILFIGDIEPWKGIGFLEKWIKNRRYHSNNKLAFRFVGQGSLTLRLKALEKLCKSSNISVEYLGPRPHSEIPQLLSEAQVLILPSYWEALPTVILEAMAAKVPVITTPVGDIPYIIQNGKNESLMNPNPKSLDYAIEFLINNPMLVKKIIIEAYRSIAKTFNNRFVHEKLLKTYINLATK